MTRSRKGRPKGGGGIEAWYRTKLKEWRKRGLLTKDGRLKVDAEWRKPWNY